MNTDIKTRWIAALRSGDYEQGYTLLNSNGKFCCLGVLCELAVDDGVVTAKDEPISGNPGMRYTALGDVYDSSITTLPWTVRNWAGLTSGDPMVGDERSYTLTQWNDEIQADFNEIADLIEKNL